MRLLSIDFAGPDAALAILEIGPQALVRQAVLLVHCAMNDNDGLSWCAVAVYSAGTGLAVGMQ